MALVNYINEHGRLKKIALYKPQISEIYQGDPVDVMYTSTPRPNRVIEEFDTIVAKFRALGVEVIVLEDPYTQYANCPNMIFLRDVASVIQDRIILSNMKYEVRKHEPIKLKSLLVSHGPLYKEHLLDVLKDETMEGADILVPERDKIFAYTGSRTSANSVDVISKELNLKPRMIAANIHNIPQHLLGGMHIVSSNVIVRRPAYCTQKMDGYTYIDLDETEEVRSGYAMNIVTIAPRVVLMPDNCPSTQSLLEKSGMTCHVVSINEIHKMGGGLACMTLPLEREAV